MSAIHISDLTFSYENHHETIFDHASFQFDTNWKTGLIGRNGRGKTTLLHLLMNRYPYRGSIRADTAFTYYPFTIQDETLTTAEAAREFLGTHEEWEFIRELSLLGVREALIDRPFSTLSPGEQTKVRLALLFLQDETFALIDEPTNHLDFEGRKLLAAYLKTKKGFLLVSHDRAFLDACVDHILVLKKHSIGVFSGNFSSWWESDRAQEAFEISENQKLQKEIRKLEGAARQAQTWADQTEAGKHKAPASGLRVDTGFVGHKSAKMMQRSKNLLARRERAVRETASLLKEVETTEDLRLFPLRHHAATLASFQGVSISYGSHELLSSLSFTIEPGERISLRGRNGSGKSSIMKLLCGTNAPDMTYTGQLSTASQLVISYISQDTSHLHGTLTEFAETRQLDLTLLLTLLRKLDMPRVQFTKNLQDFSEGQKKKVLLASSLVHPAHLYIWDEPLNYIDLYSRMQMEALLLSFPLTLLFVEHDSAFTENIATKTIYL
ncbi:MAG: ribosomal protection-like ABC-F family protein [Lachnospiraceae bacterium]